MFKLYRELEEGEQIVVACDTGNGGGDRCAAQFISVLKNDIPLVYHSSGITPDMTDKLAPALEKIAQVTNYKPIVTYELNNGGFNELKRLEGLNRSNLYSLWYGKNQAGEDLDTPGWTTHETSRKAMLTDLKDCLDSRVLKIYDKETIKELLAFVNITRPGGGWKPQAESGAHDDLVMSLAIAWQLYLSHQVFKKVRGSDGQARIFTGGDAITGHGSNFRRAGNTRVFRR